VTTNTLPDRKTLSLKDAAALEIFYRAYVPHKKPKTWRQLRKAGFKRIEEEHIDFKYICESFNEAYGYTLDYSKTKRTNK
jgi:hypothetical protein